MSTNEEEKGTLVLPTSAIIPLRRALVDAANAERKQILDLATRVHAFLKSDAGKADRLAISKALKSSNGWTVSDRLHDVSRRMDRNAHNDDRDEVYSQVADLILPHPPFPKPGEKAAPRKLQAPKKKDLPMLPAATWSFEGPECGVSINQERRTVSWRVERNNHAVDNAWDSALGKAFRQALSKIKWTRATGGVFRYSNEYAEDAALDYGSNAVSISSAFGPLGKQEQEIRYGLPSRRRAVKRR